MIKHWLDSSFAIIKQTTTILRRYGRKTKTLHNLLGSKLIYKEDETNLCVIFNPDRKWTILIRRIIGISMEEVWNHRIESSFCNFVSKFPVSQKNQKKKKINH